MLVVTGFAGANPHELNLFGIAPSEDWGIAALGLATVLAQLYWYSLRYQHLQDDGQIEMGPVTNVKYLKLPDSRNGMVWRNADLLSNRVAFVMTGLAWCFIGYWLTH